MKFIKKNKTTLIVIAVFLIVILLLLQVRNIFFPNLGRVVYGDRLSGIEEVKITSSKKTDLVNTLEDNSKVSKAKVSITGRIVEFIITVNDDVTPDAAKELATIISAELDKKVLKFYDVQIFIIKANDTDKSFPIIGYKHSAKEAFSWTKKR